LQIEICFCRLGYARGTAVAICIIGGFREKAFGEPSDLKFYASSPLPVEA